jgi:hypothetical protein
MIGFRFFFSSLRSDSARQSPSPSGPALLAFHEEPLPPLSSGRESNVDYVNWSDFFDCIDSPFSSIGNLTLFLGDVQFDD